MNTIYSYTVVRSSAPAFAAKVPYLVAIVDTGETRLSAFVEGYTDGMTVSVGDEVTYLRDDEKGRPVYLLKKPD